MNKRFLPVFKKDEQEFVFLHEDFVGNDENEAKNISLGASLVECIVTGSKRTSRILELELDEQGKGEFAHYKATLGPYHVAILSD